MAPALPVKVRFPDRDVTGEYVNDIGNMAAGQLTAFHIGRAISFEYESDRSGVFYKVRGILRAVNHGTVHPDTQGSEVWLTGIDGPKSDDDPLSDVFPVGWLHPVYVEGP